MKVTRQNGFMSKLKSIFSSETDEQSQKYIEEKKEILDQKYKLEKDKQTKRK